jgi:hypothetical protein
MFLFVFEGACAREGWWCCSRSSFSCGGVIRIWGRSCSGRQEDINFFFGGGGGGGRPKRGKF